MRVGGIERDRGKVRERNREGEERNIIGGNKNEGDSFSLLKNYFNFFFNFTIPWNTLQQYLMLLL